MNGKCPRRFSMFSPDFLSTISIGSAVSLANHSPLLRLRDYGPSVRVPSQREQSEPGAPAEFAIVLMMRQPFAAVLCKDRSNAAARSGKNDGQFHVADVARPGTPRKQSSAFAGGLNSGAAHSLFPLNISALSHHLCGRGSGGAVTSSLGKTASALRRVRRCRSMC